MSNRSCLIVPSILLAVVCAFPADAQSPLAMRLDAVQLMQQGRYTEAESVLTRLVARAPSATNTYLLGTCLLHRFRHNEALAYLEAATDANPSRHQWLNTLAECHLEMGRCDRSISILDRAIAVEPLAIYHYNKAMCALNIADLELADTELRLALDRDPVSTSALTRLGRLLAEQGRDMEAEQVLSRSVELDGTQIEALFTLGQVENRLDQPERAAQRFRDALDLYPTHAGSLYNLGRTLIATGRTEEGKEILARFSELAAAEDSIQNSRDYLATVPTALPERLQLARQLLTLGRFEEALQELEIARRVDPMQAETYSLMALAQMASGNQAEAHRAQARADELRNPPA